MNDITSHVRQKTRMSSWEEYSSPYYITVNTVVLLLLPTESTDYVCVACLKTCLT